MNNSVSDRSLYIESEEEDEEKVLNKREDNDNDGNDSDSSNASAEIHEQNKPSPYSTSWPQSYRQSIQFLSSSSLTRRHTPETLSSFTERFLQTSANEQTNMNFRGSQELLGSRSCSFGQAVLNGINVLCGVGILSTPYAVKEGGWVGLSVLFIFAVICFYTGILLRRCLDSEPGLETYADIGQAAFGSAGRVAVSILLYMELYACCVQFIILESDNWSSLFPNTSLSLGAFVLNSKHLFALIATLAILPTVWLRDLSVLSYISAGGVLASVLVVLCLLWIGVVDHVGFHYKGTALNLIGFPVAIGLYGSCYSGHAVFPTIYSSMAKPSQFPLVLLVSIGICTVLYAGVAVMGYTMFGESIESQFTLNMPHDLVASKIALWTTVVTPFAKYALTLTPVAMSLEELIPSNHLKSPMYAILIRTALVISTLLVAVAVPFFALMMALMGSFLTMLVALILPCACFLRILRGRVTWLQCSICILIIVVGVISLAIGTYSALAQIVENLIG